MVERLKVIQSHFSFVPGPNPLDSYRKAPFNTSVLKSAYYDPYSELIYDFHEFTKKSPLFDLNAGCENTRSEEVELVMRQLLYLYRLYYQKYDFSSSVTRALIGVAMSEYSQNLATRYLVFAILYIETMEFLGTSKHDSIIKSALALKHYGCFAMTEIGHGSNVAGVETTATYDASTREFVINSPTPTSAKWWIGAAAHTANRAVVFAQLIVSHVNCGVHVFEVPIKDALHKPIPSVITGNCGAKAGLAGIDNGFIIFKNYRVPYDCLLDRLSHVSPQGKFGSAIKSKEKRFGIMISGLTGGRVGILGSTEINMRNALTIAIRYSAVRLQFGQGTEVPILSYPLHKYRIMPHLAKCFAARMAYQFLLRLYGQCKDLIKSEPEGKKISEMHALLSVFKHINGKYSQSCIQECREACGGHGYSAYAGFARLREHNDIHLTWDGDNNVLIQQCSRFLLKNIVSQFKGQQITSDLFSFLNVNKPKIDSESLDCTSVLVQYLQYRTDYLAKKAVFKLQSNASTNSNEAWNNTQVHFMNNLSVAFGELVIATEFLEFSNKIKEKSQETGEVIEKLFKLYVVQIIEKEFSGLSEAEFTAVQEKVVALCEEISKYAVLIIDAIAVPDHVLGSVLGASDGKVYERYMNQVEKAPGVYDRPHWESLIGEMKKLIN